MSVWLSAANSVTRAARGQIMAELSKTQTRMIQDWQKAWIGMWLPGTARKRR